jgi:hypothetical protein
MEVALNANMIHWTARKIGDILGDVFRAIENDLHNDYGGTMEHLWIDFYLLDSYSRKPFPFRFQKRVGGSVSKLTGLPVPVWKNVGHYSLQPDLQELLALPLDAVATYALNLIYASTSVLVEKQKRLGGFDAARFRADFVSSCRRHGYEINPSFAAG